MIMKSTETLPAFVCSHHLKGLLLCSCHVSIALLQQDGTEVAKAIRFIKSWSGFSALPTVTLRRSNKWAGWCRGQSFDIKTVHKARSPVRRKELFQRVAEGLGSSKKFF